MMNQEMHKQGRDQKSQTDLIEYLRKIDTPTLANAIERLNIRSRAEGFPSLHLRCLLPELGVMCGYAVTAQVETVSTANPPQESAFIELFEAVERAPKPAIVVMQEIGSDRDRAAHAGEVMATIFSTLGAIGLISDCGVRDLAAVSKLQFHLFARGTVSSHAHFHVVRSNIPVDILGMTVRPGDLLHGDENGVIQVPAGQADALLLAVEDVLQRERELIEFVTRASFTSSMLRGRFLH
jgi:4-hydroxy-4-methyl-2-oxoglutarate aldolase